MIGRSGERGSGISVLVARHDDIYIYIYIYKCVCVRARARARVCVCAVCKRIPLLFCFSGFALMPKPISLIIRARLCFHSTMSNFKTLRLTADVSPQCSL